MAMPEIIISLFGRLLKIPDALQDVVRAYLFSLMIDSTKHTQSAAARLSGLHQSQFSRLLSRHDELAEKCLQDLSQTCAKNVSKQRGLLIKGAPWTVALIIDATLHPRSSLSVHNAQRLNHGQGFIIGHQWTNIVLYLNECLIPLPPIPFYSKNECKRRKIPYKTEHERLKEYLDALNLSQWIGQYYPEEIVVLMDAGYDAKKLQNVILEKKWDFLAALKKGRSTKTTPMATKSENKWRRIDDLFWATRKNAPWKTVHVKTNGKKKRVKYRARKLVGHLKGIPGNVALICSEKSGGKRGRMYFACSKADLDVGPILRAYRIRWVVELFHRTQKDQLGMLDAGVHDFDALKSHVHWAYCAFLLLQCLEIQGANTILAKQRRLQSLAAKLPFQTKLSEIASAKTRFGGMDRQQALLAAAIAETMVA
jgi:hypothetical protein